MNIHIRSVCVGACLFAAAAIQHLPRVSATAQSSPAGAAAFQVPQEHGGQARPLYLNPDADAGARARDGDEVVQLYVRRAVSAPGGAIRTLRGFERIPLAAGQQKRVSFPLVAERDLAMYDEARKAFVVSAGTYLVEIGASSRDLRVQGAVTVR
jgi:hypothetical protein